MCGICGYTVREKGDPPDLELLRRMMAGVAHRGPDEAGWYRDRRSALGHLRLSIIDLAGGRQPLSNEDGTLWITYNGEIFNYVELAEQLAARGHRFRTRSDTEVVVHAWEEWGEECFARFNGQWAFALWDVLRAELILSRDRHGICPLYYASTGDRFLFASEIKSLFADPSLPRELDYGGLGDVLTFWNPVAPRTCFRGVRELEPGTFARHRDGALSIRPYFRPDFPPEGKEPLQDEGENVEALRELFGEAVRLRFQRSNVPVGVYLSGGIDSSIAAAVTEPYAAPPLRTFSIRFADSEYDEGRYQRDMLDRLDSDHRELTVSYGDIGSVFPDVVRHAERPLLRTAAAPLFLLSGLVREAGVKVVLTGEGADEVFAGYDLFREAAARLFLARDPDSPRRGEILSMLYPWMTRSPAETPGFARAFFGKGLDPADPALSHRPRWNTTSSLKLLLAPDAARQIAESADPVDTLLSRMPDGHRKWHPLARAQWLEMTTLLSSYLLSAQGDRMLMAHAVEGRFPFLDPHVVDFAGRLPARHKLQGMREKHILKLAFGHLIPDSVLHRPKQPYRAPDAAAFFGDSVQDWVEAMIDPDALAEAGIFQPAAVRRLAAKCRAAGGRGLGNTDNMRMVAVLSTMLLYDQFVRGNGLDGGRQFPAEQIRTTIDRTGNHAGTRSS